MTTMHSNETQRRLDVASLALLLVGLAFGILAYWAVANHNTNPLAIVPSVVAATLGAANIVKREVPRA